MTSYRLDIRWGAVWYNVGEYPTEATAMRIASRYADDEGDAHPGITGMRIRSIATPDDGQPGPHTRQALDEWLAARRHIDLGGPDTSWSAYIAPDARSRPRRRCLPWWPPRRNRNRA